MNITVPDELLYTSEHEWIDRETGWMGITDFAQEELGDIVYVDLPEEGKSVQSMESFMVVESVKAVSDVYAPVSGEVVAVNNAIQNEPERVNKDPYGDGRLAQLAIESGLDELMQADAYRESLND